MHINDIENIMNYLFSAALKKCGNFEDAEDLTSETLLAALKYPKEINDMKKWLSAVLNHKYYDMLRRKYKLPTVSINLVSEDMFPSEEEQADVPSAEEIRREVAYLSGKYREVIVRHYLNGEKVQSIADKLDIPKGTVLSRLSAGREQIRKGFDSMERYEKQSYQPERLEITCNGCMGLNGEPFSLADGDMMKQNILTLKQHIVREILQLISIEVILIFFGLGSKSLAPENLALTASFALSVFVIYVLVGVIAWLLDIKLAQQLNSELKAFQSRFSDNNE